jgi:3(or 17)beta-hydroxysteroid dehydrogenase
MAGRLAGKAAFITGGASGLGRAMATAFAAEGARVAIADIDVERGRAAAASIGDRAIFLAHDVTSEEQWIGNLAEAARVLGRLDTLVNNAGVGARGSVETTTLAEWRHIHAVNLDGPFLGCKHAIPYIAAAGGGVRCNSIHPVYTDTPMVEEMVATARDPSKMRDALAAMIPLGRLGTPAELAAMAVYLVSDEAGFVTGAEFVFDGGYTAN